MKGFTLIEVMVAMGILAFSLVTLNMYQSYIIRSSADAEKLTVATMLARKMMVETELEVRNKPFSELKESSSGDFENYQGFSWERTMTEFKMNFPVPKNSEGSTDENMVTVASKLSDMLAENVMEVTLTIRYKVMGDDKKISIVTHIVDLVNDVDVLGAM